MVNEKIFKAYDIRGVYPSDFNEDVAYKIGRAFVKFLKCKNVVVGRDMRLSSNSIFNALSKGITDQGADVIDIGLSSTPMFYFAVANYKYDSGLMITASHNPKQYNGIKIVKEKAIPIGGNNGMEDIKQLVLKNDFFDSEEKGKIIKKEVLDDYKEHVLSFKKEMKKLKVVVDTGNGIMGYTIPRIFPQLPISLIPLFFDLDGNFPNHQANPLDYSTLKTLQKKVIEERADVGMAFDGDGDRVMFINEKGEIIPAEFITALISCDILKENPNANILYDLRSSWVVKEEIEKCHGKPIMTRVGHAFIKQQLRETNGAFAGELSGHYFYKDNFFTDSGIITAVKILNIIGGSDKKFSEIMKPLLRYYRSGEINFKVENAEKMMHVIEQTFSGDKISHLDGTKIDCDDFWINLRKSNTEPLLRLNAEAKTKEKLNEIVKKVEAIINS